MTKKEAEEKYIAMFGGLPIYFLWGRSDEEITKLLSECVRKKKELESENPEDDY